MEQPNRPFSPLAFLASLQTSNVQARNRTTGAAVSLIKQSDVKNHLSPHHRTKIHLCPPISQPDATGFSGVESAAVPGWPGEGDLTNEVAAPPVTAVAAPGNAAPPAISKSEQG